MGCFSIQEEASPAGPRRVGLAHGSCTPRPRGGALPQRRWGKSDDFHQRYNLGNCLGKGSWGRVHVARQTGGSRGQRAAVKIMRQDRAKRDSDAMVLQEVQVWARIGRHPHCVELYEVYADQALTYMVMERCEATLLDRLSQIQCMGEQEAARTFREMALALQHLHSLRIVHRDVKPDNFLFDAEGTVKLCDFGMAALMPWNAWSLYGCYGTVPYMSPEMVRNSGHSLGTDVWSLGATVYVLLYGDCPYQPSVVSPENMKAAISAGLPCPQYRRRNVEVGKPSEAATAFVGSLLVRSARQRPSIAEALRHPFLRPELPTPAVCRESSLGEVIRRARLTTEQLFKAEASKITVDRSLDGDWQEETDGKDGAEGHDQQPRQKRCNFSGSSISTAFTVGSAHSTPSFEDDGNDRPAAAV